jgi:hypothetical protein
MAETRGYLRFEPAHLCLVAYVGHVHFRFRLRLGRGLTQIFKVARYESQARSVSAQGDGHSFPEATACTGNHGNSAVELFLHAL